MKNRGLIFYLQTVHKQADACITYLEHLKTTVEYLQQEIESSHRLAKKALSPPKPIEIHYAPPPDKRPDDLVRLKEVIRMTGVSRSTIYKLINDSDFPPSQRIGSRSVAWWLRKNVDSWIASR